MSDDAAFDEAFRRELAEVGDNITDRMAVLDGDEVHRRNLDHLAAYARARRIHTERECTGGPMCVGHAVAGMLIVRRDLDDSYPVMMLLSAVAMIQELTDRAETEAVRAMRLDNDLIEARAHLEQADEEKARLRIEIDELTQRIGACEEIVAEARSGWPTAPR